MSTRGFFICGCLVSVLCEFAGSRRLAGAAPANSQLNDQAPQVATVHRSQASIVDKTPAELLQAMPELAGLEPAASQEILPEILENVGAKVESYFRNVVSTSAREETIQERIGLNGEVRETLKQAFRYLVIAHPEKGPLDFEEYRTDKENLTAGGHVRSDILLTEGFVYVPIYLHPIYQDDSDFNYVGQQTVEGHKCYVVAFAQIPEFARLRARFTEDFKPYEIMLQGIGWIDVSSFQIIRMYLEPLPGPTPEGTIQPKFVDRLGSVKQYTTEVTYSEVRFKGIDVEFWLPSEAEVNFDFGDREIKYRNHHRYSDYRLYTSQTKLIFR
jgi:hypothetical protein